MSWRGFAKGLLFCAGMIAALAAGHLFYLERYVSGGTFFALTALFLFYALAEIVLPHEKADVSPLDPEARRILGDLALLVCENALNGAKRIGRTLPCTAKEVTQMEEALMPLMAQLGVDRRERERVLQEFEKLKVRSRQEEGRRALTNSRAL